MSMVLSRPVRSVPVARPSLTEAEEQAVVGALRSGWVSQGPMVARFEHAFAEYAGAAYAIAVSSCTTALHLALIGAGVQAGDEVLCPSLSFIATANAIVHAGAVPVFVDVDQSTFNIDPACIQAAVTPKTKAILVVHQIGLPADMDAISELARRHNLVVVEDAACAAGSMHGSRKIGSPFGLSVCFSFHPRKILTTGEGGMITTDDALLAERLRRMRQHGMSISDLDRHNARKLMVETYDEVGYNCRMTDIQAAMGLVQLGRLESMISRRRELALRYTEALSRVDWLVAPVEATSGRHNFQSYMVRVLPHGPVTRDQLMLHLLEQGISSRRGIMAIHREKAYLKASWDEKLPVTNRITDSTIILPLFHDMSDDDQACVIECIEQATHRP
ncbi:MAG: aminotransferase DegT [Bryobacterales bacterium]|nr:aminotransferase DegT [Bryobacterales bacterium]